MRAAVILRASVQCKMHCSSRQKSEAAHPPAPDKQALNATLTAWSAAAKVVPSVARLFASNDRAIRRSLLEGIDSFARYFDTELVEEKIFPAIATGMLMLART